MAISMSKYISIVSGVGGTSAVSQKDMILRIYTTNALVPFNVIQEFSGDAATALASVGNYFGTTSDEYKLATQYFGWVSPKITTATKISFARYAPNAIAPTIIPTKAVPALSDFTSITNGSMVVSLNGSEYTINQLDFSEAVSLTDVAGTIQAAIRKNTDGGELWTAATVTFVANYGFELTGGVAGTATVSYASKATTGTDISGLLGWDIASAPLLSNGADAETIVAALDRTTEISNNFASFMFAETLEVADILSAANWNIAQNYRYVFCVGCNASNYTTLSAALYDKECVALTYDTTTERQEIIPSIITAATPYERTNGVIGFMYRQFPNFTPTVTTNALSSTLDSLRINYNGQTQKAGQQIAFYQDGYDQAGQQLQVVYNEIYIKDAIETACMNLMVAVTVPYNERGDGMFRAVVIPQIEACKDAGMILADKPLNVTQQAYVDDMTGTEGSWRELQNNGYILISQVAEFTDNDTKKYKWDYILLYSKGDVIVKVTGSDVMI